MLMLNKGGRLLVTCTELELIRGGNMNKIRASKRLPIQANGETNRASQRSLYWRNSSAARTCYLYSEKPKGRNIRSVSVRRRQHA